MILPTQMITIHRWSGQKFIIISNQCFSWVFEGGCVWVEVGVFWLNAISVLPSPFNIMVGILLVVFGSWISEKKTRASMLPALIMTKIINYHRFCDVFFLLLPEPLKCEKVTHSKRVRYSFTLLWWLMKFGEQDWLKKR